MYIDKVLVIDATISEPIRFFIMSIYLRHSEAELGFFYYPWYNDLARKQDLNVTP